jgi:hypothetical protein
MCGERARHGTIVHQQVQDAPHPADHAGVMIGLLIVGRARFAPRRPAGTVSFAAHDRFALASLLKCGRALRSCRLSAKGAPSKAIAMEIWTPAFAGERKLRETPWRRLDR